MFAEEVTREIVSNNQLRDITSHFCHLTACVQCDSIIGVRDIM